MSFILKKKNSFWMALTPSVWERRLNKLVSKACSEVIHSIKSIISPNQHVELQDFVSGRKNHHIIWSKTESFVFFYYYSFWSLKQLKTFGQTISLYCNSTRNYVHKEKNIINRWINQIYYKWYSKYHQPGFLHMFINTVMD